MRLETYGAMFTCGKLEESHIMKFVPKPKFTVIVPTKNEEQNIQNCLQSLNGQNTKYPYTILVVDAGSKDKTVKIAETFGAKVIIEKRPGKNIARQTGFIKSKGSILCFTEADCIVPPNWLETIGSLFLEDPKSIAVVGPYTFTNSTLYYEFLSATILPLTVYAFRLFHGHHSLRGTNFAIRRETLEMLGGFNTIAMDFDDVELSMRAKTLGKIRFVPKMKVKTLDRRFNGRILRFLTEVGPSYYRTCIRKEIVEKSVYSDIR